MNIDKYFTLDITTYAANSISIYNFDDSLVNQFINDCLIPFRQAYISDHELADNIAHMGSSRADEIASVLPAKPYLKSGDFGEILSFYLVSHIHSDANIKPLKWRWKEYKDSPCHLTDVVLLKCLDYEAPSTDDYLVSVESKSMATAPPKATSCSINDAIIGAVKDNTSRFSKTITYLMAKYKKERDFESAKFAQRFSDSITVPYQKHINAIAIINRDHYATHISNIDLGLRNANSNIAVYVIPIKDLKTVYEQIFASIPNT